MRHKDARLGRDRAGELGWFGWGGQVGCGKTKQGDTGNSVQMKPHFLETGKCTPESGILNKKVRCAGGVSSDGSGPPRAGCGDLVGSVLRNKGSREEVALREMGVG